jgi:hypothetical protein
MWLLMDVPWRAWGSGVQKTAQPVSLMAGLIRLSVYLSNTARVVVGHAAWRRLEGHLAAVELRSMHDPAFELLRIPILGT